jgi:hypothetical protein
VLLFNRGVSHTRKLEISLGKQVRNSVDEEAVAAAGTRWQAPDSTTRPTGRTEFRLTNCAIDRSMATNNWLSCHPKHNSDLQLKKNKKKKKLVLLFVPDSNTQFNSLPQIEHLIDHKMMIIMMMMKMCHFFLLPNVFPEFEHPIQFSATNLSKGFSTIELWRKNVPITFLLTIFPNKKWNCHFSRFKHPIQFSAFKLSTGWCRKCVTFYYIYWNPEPSKLKTPLVNVIPISGNNNHLNNSKWLKDFYSLDILQREMIVC